ncbi:MAG: hypothetical protein D6814_08435, partial [Calditrichaeota bacterium]
MDIQQTEEGLVGISIRDVQLRMAEAVSKSGQFQIAKVARGTSRIPFTFSALEDRSNILLLAQELNRAYESAGFSSTRASLSLDSDMVLIKKIPVDATLQGDELRSHILWEVSQFMINPLDNFIVDFELVEAAGQEKQEAEAIVVVVRKAVIEYIKEIFAATDLKLQAVDVDVFAAQRLLSKIYQFPPESKIALIDIRKKNLQISILHHNFYLSQEVEYSTEEHEEAESQRVEHLSRIISKELRRIILDNKLGKSVEDLQEIFVYGDFIEDRIIDILSEAHNVTFHRIDPFEKFPLLDTAAESDVRNHPESYV